LTLPFSVAGQQPAAPQSPVDESRMEGLRWLAAAHISKETRAFLGTRPNRFEFTFTPKHGSWLNLVESFFGKMAKTLLRGIRVASAEELKVRIELYLKEVNETPVVFRWKYKLDTLSVV
jgi:transposase